LTLDNVEKDSSATEELELVEANLKITSPTYTGIPQQVQSEFEIKALEGSQITWDLRFNQENLEVALVNSVGESLDFARNGQNFVLEDRISGSGIYAIQGKVGEEVYYDSGFFPLEMVEDLAPVVKPENKELYSYHFDEDPKELLVKAQVSDDFLVSETYLVATLARGSGENVKFRETRFEVDRKNFKTAETQVLLNLDVLDFKPGDELYYYWAALDNKSPEANYSRSDTYFINYVDSTGITEEQLVGMAIHVMPEYFRSQRQIIIDTEKLVSTKSSFSEGEYTGKSNEIGYDQKLLRMRYGQYLGEEFESNAGGEINEAGNSEDMLEGYRHDHDEESEAGMSETLANQAAKSNEENHSHGEEEEGGIEGILDAYLHSHDSEEVNTFYEASTKNLLKMALDQMWQSELHLRLGEPEEALPYQEKALDYLKTVQQKSRVYVKRTGFDPPPLKIAEKRLTGELKDLDAQIKKDQLEMRSNLKPLAARVLGLLVKDRLSSADQEFIQSFGEMWTKKMKYSGVQDWGLLLHLQELSSGEIGDEGRRVLFEKLYPLSQTSGDRDPSFLNENRLEKAFWNAIK